LQVVPRGGEVYKFESERWLFIVEMRFRLRHGGEDEMIVT
jgi:hypothetical protein